MGVRRETQKGDIIINRWRKSVYMVLERTNSTWWELKCLMPAPKGELGTTKEFTVAALENRDNWLNVSSDVSQACLTKDMGFTDDGVVVGWRVGMQFVRAKDLDNTAFLDVATVDGHVRECPLKEDWVIKGVIKAMDEKFENKEEEWVAV